MNKISRRANLPAISFIAAPLRTAVLSGIIFFISGTAAVRADQIEMQNGDRFVGHVVSLNESMLVLQNDNLGKITLPRARISTITLKPSAVANSPSSLTPGSNTSAPLASAPGAPRSASTNAAGDPADSALRSLGANTNLIEQVRGQFLSGAGGAANGKFDELLTGLMNGKMNMDDLRAQAKTSADQLRQLKRESGGSADAALDVYLDILDNFLKETAQPPNLATPTNAAAAKSN